MRFKAILLLSIFVVIAAPANAIDNVEAAIVKCRAKTNTQAEQVTCLENALRTMVPSTGEPDWGGTQSLPRNPDQAINTTPSTEARGIGAEQIPLNRDRAAAARTRLNEQSVVADFAYNQSNRLILVLSNGQVWKQRSGDLNTVRLNKGDRPTVIVRPGAVSGYRMEFPEQKQTIVVSRLQ